MKLDSFGVDTSFDYSGSASLDTDEAIRKCLKSNSEKELIDALDKCNVAFRNKYFSESVSFSYIALQAILLEKSKEIRNAVLPMYFRMLLSEYQPEYNIIRCLQNDLLFLLMRECVSDHSGLNEEYCKVLIDSYISNQIEIISRLAVTDVPFIQSPLYILMVTEKYSLVRYYLEKVRAELGSKRLGVLTGYVESAIRYKQDEFIRILIEEGYFIQKDNSALAYIFSNEGALDFLTRIIPLSEPADTLEELESLYNKDRTYRFCILRETQLDLTILIYKQYGIDGVNSFYEKVSRTSTVFENDFYSAIYNFPFVCAIDKSYGLDDLFNSLCSDPASDKGSEPVPTASPFRTVEDFMNVCTEPGYRFVVEDCRTLVRYQNYYDPHEITFDFTGLGDEISNLTGFSNKNLNKFFKKNDLLFDKEKFTIPHRQFLELNDYSLTELLVKKGAFTDKTIGEAIRFSVENRCYKSLDAITKTYTGGMNA